MIKLDSAKVLKRLKVLKINSTDIIMLQLGDIINDSDDLDALDESVSGLTEIIRDAGIENPLIVLGPDASLDTLSEEMLETIGLYRKNDVDTDVDDEIDELYT